MLPTLIAVASASVVGSLHCAAMCGGLVSFTCGTSSKPRVEQIAYHTGRLLIYTGLGAAAAYAGQGLNQTASFVGLQNVAGVLSGVVMMLWALLTLLQGWRSRRPALAEPQKLSITQRRPNRLGQWFAWLHQLPTGVRGGLLGLTSAVLPCGWLYAFVVAAAGQESVPAGAALMAAFWFGSLPMLLGLGGLVSLLGAKSRRYLPQVSTLVLLGLGLSTVILRRPPLLFASSLEAASAASNAQTSSCHHH